MFLSIFILVAHWFALGYFALGRSELHRDFCWLNMMDETFNKDLYRCCDASEDPNNQTVIDTGTNLEQVGVIVAIVILRFFSSANRPGQVVNSLSTGCQLPPPPLNYKCQFQEFGTLGTLSPTELKDAANLSYME